jgi:hypothetical protein
LIESSVLIIAAAGTPGLFSGGTGLDEGLPTLEMQSFDADNVVSFSAYNFEFPYPTGVHHAPRTAAAAYLSSPPPHLAALHALSFHDGN